MNLTYKYRLYPTKSQIVFLEGELKEACSLYNAALEERIGAWKVCRKSISYYDQAEQLPAMRKDGCLTLTNAQCSQEVLHRVDKAFKAFFRRVKRGERPGYPRFKSRHRYDSLTHPQYGKGCKLLDNGKLRVQGAGHIKIKLHRPIEGKIKTVTIKRSASRWFVCFSVEYAPKPLPVNNRKVGIDLGLTSFIATSDGSHVIIPKYFKDSEAKLRRAQRKVARRHKGSNRRRKALVLLQKTHAHVKNQRADAHHKVSYEVVKAYGFIAVEDLNIRSLASGMLAKSVANAGWGQFLQFLSYKAESAGRVLVRVDPRGTSQTCVCGNSVPKSLGDRWHSCSHCGLSENRDTVSAMIILQRAWTKPSSVNVEVVNSCVA